MSSTSITIFFFLLNQFALHDSFFRDARPEVFGDHEKTHYLRSGMSDTSRPIVLCQVLSPGVIPHQMTVDDGGFGSADDVSAWLGTVGYWQ